VPGLLRSQVLDGPNGRRRVALILAAIGFVTAGSLHFIFPGPYIRIVPPWLPCRSQLVAISGFFEILGGAGLLIGRVRRNAAWGLVALLTAVFPANIYMATNPVEAGAASVPAILLWARLPLQVFFIWCVLWCTRPRP
jgi:uncharacterized membrane protein